MLGLKKALNYLGKHFIGQGKILHHHKPIFLNGGGDIGDKCQKSHPSFSSQVPLISSNFSLLNFPDDVVNLCFIKVLVASYLVHNFFLGFKAITGSG